MKYFSIETVVNAYKGFQDSMTNKSWGYLALLKGCNDSIRPLIPYEVNMDVVSNFLEGIFNLSPIKKHYNGGRSLYVVFSNKWEDYFNDQGRYSPNIYDVAVWAYRRKAFPDDITEEYVIIEFSKEFNIPFSIIKESFNTKQKKISFSDTLYSEATLKSELGHLGVDVSRDNIDAKKGGVVAAPGEISRGPFVQTLYAGLEITDYVLILQSDYFSLYGDKEKISENNFDDNREKSLQQIFYGAPGTGKSNAIKREVDDKGKTNFRVTFHPDSDYSTFVGCYKPAMKENIISKNGVESKEEQIVYRFVPQAFTKAYTAAWNTEDEVYLVIEEINRGNCAQIFGDLFQLLDRKNGVSEYPVDADSDLADYIRKSLKNSSRTDFPDGVKDGKKLVLPSNLFIWATMNTSDQSLFPIDSAFKRRWDWKYLPIEDAEKGWKIKVNGNEYDWYKFLDAINKEVLGLTHSEDKQLGYFFAKAKDGIIDAETLVNKVYFYLWTDVFKDYDYESQKAFRKPNSNEPIAFKDFFKKGQELDEIMAEQVLINLELEKLNKPQDLFE